MRTTLVRLTLALAAVVLSATAGLAQRSARADSIAVARTVERFHAALERGDSTAALALLTRDVEVLETGGVESRAEYRSHHLSSDIEFARAVRSVRAPVKVRVRGNVAWTSSTSTARGTFRDRPVDSVGAESMVLLRTPQGWRIAAIHWSSRRRS